MGFDRADRHTCIGLSPLLLDVAGRPTVWLYVTHVSRDQEGKQNAS